MDLIRPDNRIPKYSKPSTLLVHLGPEKSVSIRAGGSNSEPQGLSWQGLVWPTDISDITCWPLKKIVFEDCRNYSDNMDIVTNPFGELVSAEKVDCLP